MNRFNIIVDVYTVDEITEFISNNKDIENNYINPYIKALKGKKSYNKDIAIIGYLAIIKKALELYSDGLSWFNIANIRERKAIAERLEQEYFKSIKGQE